MNKKITIGIIVGVAFLIIGCVYFFKDKNTETQAFVIETTAESIITQPQTEELICVYVCGQVKNPGVYYLEPGSRVFDAVNAAGGLLENAQENSINQAETVVDCEKIYISDVNEEAGASNDAGNGLINLNKAGVSELTTLPGIGESRAKAIIEYRENNGPFSTIEDVMKVAGIKDAAFNKIKEYICV